MTAITIELLLSFVIWPYLVVLLVYLHDWINKKPSRKVAKK